MIAKLQKAFKIAHDLAICGINHITYKPALEEAEILLKEIELEN